MEENKERQKESSQRRISFKNQSTQISSINDVFKNHYSHQKHVNQFKRIGSIKKLHAYTKKIDLKTNKQYENSEEDEKKKYKRIGTLRKILAVIYDEATKTNEPQLQKVQESQERLQGQGYSENIEQRKEKQQDQYEETEDKILQISEELNPIIHKKINEGFKLGQSEKCFEQMDEDKQQVNFVKQESGRLEKKDSLSSNAFSVDYLLHLPEISSLLARTAPIISEPEEKSLNEHEDQGKDQWDEREDFLAEENSENQLELIDMEQDQKVHRKKEKKQVNFAIRNHLETKKSLDSYHLDGNGLKKNGITKDKKKGFEEKPLTQSLTSPNLKHTSTSFYDSRKGQRITKKQSKIKQDQDLGKSFKKTNKLENASIHSYISEARKQINYKK